MILNETSYFGAGSRKVIAEEVAKRGYKKALVVTDKDLVKFGVAAQVTDVLKAAGIPFEMFDEVKPNPTVKNVKNGIAAFKAAGADFIVAIGGGSSMDTSKAVGIIINNPEFADVTSLEGVANTKKTLFILSFVGLLLDFLCGIGALMCLPAAIISSVYSVRLYREEKKTSTQLVWAMIVGYVGAVFGILFLVLMIR